MAKTKKKTSKKSSSAPQKQQQQANQQQQQHQKDQADAFLEGLQTLSPQDHINAVRPFWASLTHDQRVELLRFPLDELRAFAQVQLELKRKQDELEAAEAVAQGRTILPLSLGPDLVELLDEAIKRTKEKGTWKVWHWPAHDKTFYDSESFRKYLEEHLIDPDLLKSLPREEDGAKVAERPAEAAFRQRMVALLTKIHEQRQMHEEALYQRPRITVSKQQANQQQQQASQQQQQTLPTTSTATGGPVRDFNAEQVAIMLTAMEKEHESLYHMMLLPVCAFICEVLPEGARRTTLAELAYEDLESISPEDAARISEFLSEKIDALTSKLKPEAKDLELEENEEPIGDVDLFTLTEDQTALCVNDKWLGHLETRLLGEDGQPRKTDLVEDPTGMGLVLEWAYGTIVSTAEKSRDGASRSLGTRPPSPTRALELLNATLKEQAAWEECAKQTRETLVEMLNHRKRVGELLVQYPELGPLGVKGTATTGAAAEEAHIPENVPDEAILAVLRKEELLTKAKIQHLEFELPVLDRRLKQLRAQSRQIEPEIERLKRELEELKSNPRGTGTAGEAGANGNYRSNAEMERHRAQLADIAIEEQIEVQHAYREQGIRFNKIGEAAKEVDTKMNRYQAEVRQLNKWLANITDKCNGLEQALAMAAPITKAAEATAGKSSDEADALENGDAAAHQALVAAVKSITQHDETLKRYRFDYFQEKGLKKQVYGEKEDLELFNILKKQLKVVDEKIEEGKAALQHLENFVINVTCNDPGAMLGVNIILPYLQDRLDGKALEHAALLAAEAENAVIAMEAEMAEKERAEKEKKAKAKQKAKEKLRLEKEKEKLELEAEEKKLEAQREEQRRQKEQEQQAQRAQREKEVEEQRRKEEEMMEQRRKELLEDEHSYWRMRLEQEELLAAENEQKQAQLLNSQDDSPGAFTAAGAAKKHQDKNNKASSNKPAPTKAAVMDIKPVSVAAATPPAQPTSPTNDFIPPPPPPTPQLDSGAASPVRIPGPPPPPTPIAVAPVTPERAAQPSSVAAVSAPIPAPPALTADTVTGAVAAQPPPALYGDAANAPMPPPPPPPPPHLPPPVMGMPAHLQHYPGMPPPSMMYYPPPPPSNGGPPPVMPPPQVMGHPVDGGMYPPPHLPPPPIHMQHMLHPPHMSPSPPPPPPPPRQQYGRTPPPPPPPPPRVPQQGMDRTGSGPTRLRVTAAEFVPGSFRVPTPPPSATDTNSNAAGSSNKVETTSPRGILESSGSDAAVVLSQNNETGTSNSGTAELRSTSSNVSSQGPLSDSGSSGGQYSNNVRSVTPPPPPPPRPPAQQPVNAFQHGQQEEMMAMVQQHHAAVVDEQQTSSKKKVQDVKNLKSVRGMTNAPGLYNCFVNVIVQTLWHLTSFRRTLLALPASELASAASAKDVAVLTALQNIFRDMQEGAESEGSDAKQLSSVSASELRRALGALHGSSFRLDDMHDAAEALGEIFDCLHRAHVGPTAAGSDPFLPRKVKVAVADTKGWAGAPAHVQNSPISTPPVTPAPSANGSVWGNGAALAKVKQAPQQSPTSKAAAHQQANQTEQQQSSSFVQKMFGLEVQVHVADANGEHSSSSKDSSPTKKMKAPINTSSSKSKDHVEALQYTKYFHLIPAQGLRKAGLQSFEATLIAAESAGNTQSVASSSLSSAHWPVTRLLGQPKVVTLGIVWESPQAPVGAIAATMKALSTKLDTSKAFATATAEACMYDLVGVVCYSRSHYKAFAFNQEAEQWLCFDDTDVSVTGDWSDVVAVVQQQRLQPSVLFFESE